MSESLEQLLSYCRENGRVCPVPTRWNELYQMLPETRQKGLGWEPSSPLILAAWWVLEGTVKAMFSQTKPLAKRRKSFGGHIAYGVPSSTHHAARIRREAVHNRSK